MKENGKLPHYLESWSEELLSRASRVRQLIGDSHWGTDGHHKEAILREMLSRYLSPSLNIGGGFIKNLDLNICSSEIDILISDSNRHPPFFNEGGVQIIPPSSAVAIFEVKSTFRADVLHDALTKISKAQSALGNTPNSMWKCICFAYSENNFDKFKRALNTQVGSLVGALETENSAEVIQHLPNCIVTLDRYIAFPKASIQEKEVSVNIFEYENLSIAIALSDLFDQLRSQEGFLQAGELMQANLQFRPQQSESLKFELK